MSKPPIIYLDYAAATPLDPRVLAAMRPYLAGEFYNPSATYSRALGVKKALIEARSSVARWLGARSSEVIFTAGGSEANNLAIHGLMRQFPEGNIVVSGLEHESVLEPAHGYDCREVAVQADGRLDLDDLRQKIDANSVLVSIMYANNEIGTVQPVRQVAKVVADQRQQRRRAAGSKPARPLYFHSDAAQAANYLDLHVARLGIDMMTLNGGKLYGPKQTGVLYVKSGLKLLPLVQGGGQERGLRSGTENVAGAIGLAAALELAQASRHQELDRLTGLQGYFFERLKAILPAATVNGSLKYRLPNNIHFTLPGHDNERLLIQLDEAGIMAAAGSACSASRQTPSHVLRALGLSDEQARSSLRFTMGRGTNQADIQRCLKLLAEVLQ